MYPIPYLTLLYLCKKSSLKWQNEKWELKKMVAPKVAFKRRLSACVSGLKKPITFIKFRHIK